MKRTNAFYEGATRYGGSAAVAKRHGAARRTFFSASRTRPETNQNQELSVPMVLTCTIGSQDIIRKDIKQAQLTNSANRILKMIEETSVAPQTELSKRQKSNSSHRYAPFFVRPTRRPTSIKSTISAPTVDSNQSIQQDSIPKNDTLVCKNAMQAHAIKVTDDPPAVKPKVEDIKSPPVPKLENFTSKTITFTDGAIKKKVESPDASKKQPPAPEPSIVLPPNSFKAPISNNLQPLVSKPEVPIMNKPQPVVSKPAPIVSKLPTIVKSSATVTVNLPPVSNSKQPFVFNATESTKIPSFKPSVVTFPSQAPVIFKSSSPEPRRLRAPVLLDESSPFTFKFAPSVPNSLPSKIGPPVLVDQEVVMPKVEEKQARKTIEAPEVVKPIIAAPEVVKPIIVVPEVVKPAIEPPSCENAAPACPTDVKDAAPISTFKVSDTPAKIEDPAPAKTLPTTDIEMDIEAEALSAPQHTPAPTPTPSLTMPLPFQAPIVNNLPTLVNSSANIIPNLPPVLNNTQPSIFNMMNTTQPSFNPVVPAFGQTSTASNPFLPTNSGARGRKMIRGVRRLHR